MRVELKERRLSPDSRRGDLLDHIMQEADNEKFLTEEFIVQLMYSLIFVFSDSLSTTLALAITLLHDHPLALQELIVCIVFPFFFVMFCFSFWVKLLNRTRFLII